MYPPKMPSATRTLLADLGQLAPPNAEIVIKTNGIAITPAWVDFILDHRSGSIIDVSIDTANPDSYRKIRIGDELWALYKNLNYLQERKTAHGLDKPELQFSIVLADFTAADLPHALSYTSRFSPRFLNLQILNPSGGYACFHENHAIFNGQRKQELSARREVVKDIAMPSNKDDILAMIGRFV